MNMEAIPVYFDEKNPSGGIPVVRFLSNEDIKDKQRLHYPGNNPLVGIR